MKNKHPSFVAFLLCLIISACSQPVKNDVGENNLKSNKAVMEEPYVFPQQTKAVNDDVANLFGMPNLAAVRAFHMTNNSTHILDEKGHVNRNRQPAEGIALSSPQTRLLHSGLHGAEAPTPVYMPTYPNFGFIFLDETGEILAGVSYESAFGGFRTDSRLPIETLDNQALHTLIDELDFTEAGGEPAYGKTLP